MPDEPLTQEQIIANAERMARAFSNLASNSRILAGVSDDVVRAWVAMSRTSADLIAKETDFATVKSRLLDQWHRERAISRATWNEYASASRELAKLTRTAKEADAAMKLMEWRAQPMKQKLGEAFQGIDRQIARIASTGLRAVGLGLGVRELIQSNQEFNRSLFETGRQAERFGESLTDIRSQFQRISQSTEMSMQDFSDLNRAVKETMLGIPMSTRQVADWVETLRGRFGFASESIKKGFESLLSIQQKVPDLFENVRSVQEAYNRSTAEGDRLAVQYRYTLETLGASRQEIQTVMNAMQPPPAALQGVLRFEQTLAKTNQQFENAQLLLAQKLAPTLEVGAKAAGEVAKALSEIPTILTQIGAGLIALSAIGSFGSMGRMMTGQGGGWWKALLGTMPMLGGGGAQPPKAITPLWTSKSGLPPPAGKGLPAAIPEATAATSGAVVSGGGTRGTQPTALGKPSAGSGGIMPLGAGGERVSGARVYGIPGVTFGIGAFLSGKKEWEERQEETRGRQVAGTAIRGAAGGAGALASMAAGAAVGTLFGPGVGTVIGGIVGLAIGSQLVPFADKLGDRIAGAVLDRDKKPTSQINLEAEKIAIQMQRDSAREIAEVMVNQQGAMGGMARPLYEQLNRHDQVLEDIGAKTKENVDNLRKEAVAKRKELLRLIRDSADGQEKERLIIELINRGYLSTNDLVKELGFNKARYTEYIRKAAQAQTKHLSTVVSIQEATQKNIQAAKMYAEVYAKIGEGLPRQTLEMMREGFPLDFAQTLRMGVAAARQEMAEFGRISQETIIGAMATAGQIGPVGGLLGPELTAEFQKAQQLIETGTERIVELGNQRTDKMQELLQAETALAHAEKQDKESDTSKEARTRVEALRKEHDEMAQAEKRIQETIEGYQKRRTESVVAHLRRTGQSVAPYYDVVIRESMDKERELSGKIAEVRQQLAAPGVGPEKRAGLNLQLDEYELQRRQQSMLQQRISASQGEELVRIQKRYNAELDAMLAPEMAALKMTERAIGLAERRRQLAEINNLGLLASYTYTKQSVELLQQQLHLLDSQSQRLQSNLMAMQAQYGVQIDIGNLLMNEAAEVTRIQQALHARNVEQSAAREMAIGMVTNSKRLLELEDQRLSVATQQAELTKKIREGYLDAFAEAISGAGDFTALIGTMDKATTQYLKAGAPATFRYGGLGGPAGGRLPVQEPVRHTTFYGALSQPGGAGPFQRSALAQHTNLGMGIIGNNVPQVAMGQQYSWDALAGEFYKTSNATSSLVNIGEQQIRHLGAIDDILSGRRPQGAPNLMLAGLFRENFGTWLEQYSHGGIPVSNREYLPETYRSEDYLTRHLRHTTQPGTGRYSARGTLMPYEVIPYPKAQGGPIPAPRRFHSGGQLPGGGYVVSAAASRQHGGLLDALGAAEVPGQAGQEMLALDKSGEAVVMQAPERVLSKPLAPYGRMIERGAVLGAEKGLARHAAGGPIRVPGYQEGEIITPTHKAINRLNEYEKFVGLDSRAILGPDLVKNLTSAGVVEPIPSLIREAIDQKDFYKARDLILKARKLSGEGKQDFGSLLKIMDATRAQEWRTLVEIGDWPELSRQLDSYPKTSAGISDLKSSIDVIWAETTPLQKARFARDVAYHNWRKEQKSAKTAVRPEQREDHAKKAQASFQTYEKSRAHYQYLQDELDIPRQILESYFESDRNTQSINSEISTLENLTSELQSIYDHESQSLRNKWQTEQPYVLEQERERRIKAELSDLESKILRNRRVIYRLYHEKQTLQASADQARIQGIEEYEEKFGAGSFGKYEQKALVEITSKKAKVATEQARRKAKEEKDIAALPKAEQDLLKGRPDLTSAEYLKQRERLDPMNRSALGQYLLKHKDLDLAQTITEWEQSAQRSAKSTTTILQNDPRVTDFIEYLYAQNEAEAVADYMALLSAQAEAKPSPATQAKLGIGGDPEFLEAKGTWSQTKDRLVDLRQDYQKTLVASRQPYLHISPATVPIASTREIPGVPGEPADKKREEWRQQMEASLAKADPVRQAIGQAMVETYGKKETTLGELALLGSVSKQTDPEMAATAKELRNIYASKAAVASDPAEVERVQKLIADLQKGESMPLWKRQMEGAPEVRKDIGAAIWYAHARGERKIGDLALLGAATDQTPIDIIQKANWLRQVYVSRGELSEADQTKASHYLAAVNFAGSYGMSGIDIAETIPSLGPTRTQNLRYLIQHETEYAAYLQARREAKAADTLDKQYLSGIQFSPEDVKRRLENLPQEEQEQAKQKYQAAVEMVEMAREYERARNKFVSKENPKLWQGFVGSKPPAEGTRLWTAYNVHVGQQEDLGAPQIVAKPMVPELPAPTVRPAAETIVRPTSQPPATLQSEVYKRANLPVPDEVKKREEEAAKAAASGAGTPVPQVPPAVTEALPSPASETVSTIETPPPVAKVTPAVTGQSLERPPRAWIERLTGRVPHAAEMNNPALIAYLQEPANAEALGNIRRAYPTRILTPAFLQQIGGGVAGSGADVIAEATREPAAVAGREAGIHAAGEAAGAEATAAVRSPLMSDDELRRAQAIFAGQHETPAQQREQLRAEGKALAEQAERSGAYVSPAQERAQRLAEGRRLAEEAEFVGPKPAVPARRLGGLVVPGYQDGGTIDSVKAPSAYERYVKEHGKRLGLLMLAEHFGMGSLFRQYILPAAGATEVAMMAWDASKTVHRELRGQERMKPEEHRSRIFEFGMSGIAGLGEHGEREATASGTKRQTFAAYQKWIHQAADSGDYTKANRLIMELRNELTQRGKKPLSQSAAELLHSHIGYVRYRRDNAVRPAAASIAVTPETVAMTTQPSPEAAVKVAAETKYPIDMSPGVPPPEEMRDRFRTGTPPLLLPPEAAVEVADAEKTLAVPSPVAPGPTPVLAPPPAGIETHAAPRPTLMSEDELRRAQAIFAGQHETPAQQREQLRAEGKALAEQAERTGRYVSPAQERAQRLAEGRRLAEEAEHVSPAQERAQRLAEGRRLAEEAEFVGPKPATPAMQEAEAMERQVHWERTRAEAARMGQEAVQYWSQFKEPAAAAVPAVPSAKEAVIPAYSGESSTVEIPYGELNKWPLTTVKSGSYIATETESEKIRAALVQPMPYGGALSSALSGAFEVPSLPGSTPGKDSVLAMVSGAQRESMVALTPGEIAFRDEESYKNAMRSVASVALGGPVPGLALGGPVPGLALSGPVPGLALGGPVAQIPAFQEGGFVQPGRTMGETFAGDEWRKTAMGPMPQSAMSGNVSVSANVHLDLTAAAKALVEQYRQAELDQYGQIDSTSA